MASPLRFPEFGFLPGTRVGYAFLYAFQCTDGAVKVGRSTFPRDRLTVHKRNLQRQGKDIARFSVRPISGRLDEAERELIARMARFGVTVDGTAEWFLNVSWGAAQNLLRQIARRDFVTAQSLPRGGTQRAPLPAGQCAGGLSFSND
jgi:hypothetical protein